MRAQVVVIGGGAFGASCFYHLTGRGVRDVVLLEQAGFHESVALQRAHGLHDARVIGPDEVARIVPALRVDDLAGAL